MQRTFEYGIITKAIANEFNIATAHIGNILDKNVSTNYRVQFDEINRFEESEVNDEDESKWSSISLQNLILIFKVLFFSFILAAIIISIEYIINELMISLDSAIFMILFSK